MIGPAWTDQAACGPEHDALFVPASTLPREAKDYAYSRALLVCAQCPVVADCRQFAKDLGERSGVWGGRRLDGRSPVPSAVCGTPAGYSRHRKAGEIACRACREAIAAHNRARQAATAPKGNRKRPSPPPDRRHGTLTGYRYHYALGEKACAECREAYNAWARARYAKRRAERQAVSA